MLKTISIRKSLDLSKTNAKLKKCWQAPAFARASIRPGRVQGSPSSSSFSSFVLVLGLIRADPRSQSLPAVAGCTWNRSRCREEGSATAGMSSVPKFNLGTRGLHLGTRGSRTKGNRASAISAVFLSTTDSQLSTYAGIEDENEERVRGREGLATLDPRSRP